MKTACKIRTCSIAAIFAAIAGYGMLGTATTGFAEGSITASATATVVDPPAAVVVISTFSIVVVPISADSNLLFGPVAPVPAPAASAPATQTSADTRAELTPTSGPKLNSLIGKSAVVAVSGAPNQTYSVSLPESATIFDGDTVFQMTEFNHNAGVTPAIGANGSGVFDIGAKVLVVSASEFAAQPAISEAGSASDAEIVEPVAEVPESDTKEPTAETSVDKSKPSQAADADLSETISLIVEGKKYQGPIVTESPFLDIVISYN